ncbi:MAG: hypothetical protein QXT64_08735 [Desulfurococcaceae archaeon]
MSISEKLCRNLIEFLGPELVRCWADTIDYQRLDTYSRMKERKMTEWRAYYTGSLWVNERKGTVDAGDVVGLLEMADELARRVRGFGCRVTEIHRYPQFGTAHIHLTECPVKGKEREFARLITR